MWDDDQYITKLFFAVASNATTISFTLGFPNELELDLVHKNGKTAVSWATGRSGVEHIATSSADVIGVQGPNTGGHQATDPEHDAADGSSLEELIAYARQQSDKPVIAAGGVGGPEDVQRLLAAGANAVQVGTMFLLAEEAGTKPTHRRALTELRDRETVVTTAFTGRAARAIRNRFSDRMAEHSPGLYPAQHFASLSYLGIAENNDDVELLDLWAGTGFANARPGTAAKIINWLSGS